MQNNLPNSNDAPNSNQNIANSAANNSSSVVNSNSVIEEKPVTSIGGENNTPSKRAFRKVNLSILPILVLGIFVFASASFLFYFRKTGVDPLSLNNDGYNSDFTSYELDDYIDVLVSVPDACIADDFIGELTSGWNECNYCYDENQDGIYDNPQPGEETNCLQREIICREKSLARYNSIAPGYPDLFGGISVPSYSITDTSDEARIAWFNWGHQVVVKAPNSADTGHILSKGTACGMGAVCCIAPPELPTYTQCKVDRCVVVDGEGNDECSVDFDCTHLECSDLTCERVPGSGSDTCTDDPDCYRLECNDNQQCVQVVGDGADLCSSDNDCVIPTPTPSVIPSPTPSPIPSPTPIPTPTPSPTPVTYLTCVDQQCVSVVGDQQNECSVDNDCVPPPPDPTIACQSLTGAALDSLGQQYDVSALPNDFVGVLNLTCRGESTVKPIVSMEFELFKQLGSELYKDSKVLNSSQITQVSNQDGVMLFEGSTSFEITGQGEYSVTSKVCNEDNICSQ